MAKAPTRMRVADLRPSDRNPRTISTSRLENLKRSLEADRAFLDARPLLVNAYPGRENVVVAGNMRLRAAQELGWEEVPVLVVSLPPDLEAKWNLKDNNRWGDYVVDDLTAILADLAGHGADLDLLGFEPDALERLLARVSAGAPGDDDAFDPTPPTDPESEPGDLLLLGPHRLVCGDSRARSTWDLLMSDDGAANAMWTDPPYGVDLKIQETGQPAMDGDRPHDIEPLLGAVFPLVDAHLRPGGPFYIAAPHGRTLAAFMEAVEAVGWHHAQTLVWVKDSFVLGRADYHYQHEAILYGWKLGAAHAWIGPLDQATVMDDEPNVSRMSREALLALVKSLRNARTTDVLREGKNRNNDLHPTMKPTGLIRQLLGNSTRRGDLVLDPFAGAGSTIVAAHLMGRRVAAIELEPRFCDVIVRRWRELDPANNALRVRHGATEAVGSPGGLDSSPERSALESTGG